MAVAATPFKVPGYGHARVPHSVPAGTVGTRYGRNHTHELTQLALHIDRARPVIVPARTDHRQAQGREGGQRRHGKGWVGGEGGQRRASSGRGSGGTDYISVIRTVRIVRYTYSTTIGTVRGAGRGAAAGAAAAGAAVVLVLFRNISFTDRTDLTDHQ